MGAEHSDLPHANPAVRATIRRPVANDRPRWFNPAEIMNALIAIAVLGAIVGLIIVATAYLLSRRRPAMAPPPPFQCPSCGSQDIEYVVQGMWDGLISGDLPVGGGYSYGTCKRCGGRCARESKSYPDGRIERRESFVPTEAEWLSHTAPAPVSD